VSSEEKDITKREQYYTHTICSNGKFNGKFIAHRDVCQRVKHPNKAYEIEYLSHLPNEPGELMTLDLYGPLPTGSGGVKYLLVCLDVFSKHVSLYPLKTATSRSYLNKLVNHYFPKVILPQIILSDHGSQFTSLTWKKRLLPI
jgi:transposase InsO family protein